MDGWMEGKKTEGKKGRRKDMMKEWKRLGRKQRRAEGKKWGWMEGEKEA